MEEPRIIIALDYPNGEQALNLTRQLDPARCRLKVGKELFTRAGPGLVERLADQGFSIFLDLKFHDIPHTVARACLAAADLGVWMLNVHALGGLSMMQAAQEALAKTSSRPFLIAVTVLTSMDQTALAQIGLSGTAEENVLRLARLTQEAGLDGVVCSGQEASALRQALGTPFLLVTPGIRSAGTASGDQQRVLTPREALSKGANYLVIGRPITGAPDPMAALEGIEAEILDF
ncbi:orotidine 5'-phosphate decarboxylase [Nitrosococcus halophilus Nc 4]|uniref:Orotidine 5'-phosphate decarboxylase n=1 Tax=Nitrosococcus halophilus (strain Nc4) TaxID=472759 RepID=D5BV89_NITHN|nr:orotidine-5'-phosphate decarboxylase [Nitrosococcus halophilus]ADE15439.1 orotidine 5'-phosphate decarboxylase [Nitrosococcus halophilus Nc 4]